MKNIGARLDEKRKVIVQYFKFTLPNIFSAFLTMMLKGWFCLCINYFWNFISSCVYVGFPQGASALILKETLMCFIKKISKSLVFSAILTIFTAKMQNMDE